MKKIFFTLFAFAIGYSTSYGQRATSENGIYNDNTSYLYIGTSPATNPECCRVIFARNMAG